MAIKKYRVEVAGLRNRSIPISHAVVVNNRCLTTWKLAVNSKGIYEETTIQGETDFAFSNLFAAFTNRGFDKEEVLFVDVAFDVLIEFPIGNAIFMKLFPENKRPARTIRQDEALPYGGKIKIMGTAVKDIIT